MDIVDLGEPDRGRLPPDTAGERAVAAKTAKRFAFRNARACKPGGDRIREMQPLPLLRRHRQCRRLGASDERCKLTDDAHNATLNRHRRT